MAKKNSEKRQFEQMVEMGKNNAALIPRLHRWCDHLEVQQTSGGLYAQMTGLPIGTMNISCIHAAQPSMQAMQLDRVASFFVTQNCRNCPHHKELSPDNVGREILKAAEQIESEAAQTTTPISEPKRLLQSLVSGDITKALETATTTEQSILELVALLDDQAHSKRAAQLLLAAADVAPEFFSELACAVIAEHFTESANGATCAETIAKIAEKRKNVPESAISKGWESVGEQFCHDAIMQLLALSIHFGAKIPDTKTVCQIIGHISHRQLGVLFRKPVIGSGQFDLLSAIALKAPELLVTSLQLKLKSNSKHQRIPASLTINRFAALLTPYSEQLSKSLITSLCLDDDEDHQTSADFTACEALAHLYIRNPDSVEKCITSFLPQCDDEVQVILLKTYSITVRHFRDEEKQFIDATAAQHSLRLILASLVRIVDSKLVQLEVRCEAAEIIKEMGHSSADILIEKHELIFGQIALIQNEKIQFEEANPGSDPQLPGFPRQERIQYDTIVSRLIAVLEDITEVYPEKLYPALSSILSTLNSNDETQASVKARLIGLLETICKTDSLAPACIPTLYKFLMDTDSVLVRVAALRVIGEIISTKPDVIPDNMIEVVVIYLKDLYVAVHKEAVRALRNYSPRNPYQMLAIVFPLTVQFGIYRGKAHEEDHIEAISDTLRHLCRGYIGVYSNFALPALIELCRSSDPYKAKDALKTFSYEVESMPHIKHQYIIEICSFFERFADESMDFKEYSSEQHQLSFLCSLSREELSKHLDPIQRATKALCSKNRFAAEQLISLFLRHEQFTVAAMLADFSIALIPSGAKHEHIRNQAQLFAAIAHSEAKVALGQATDAIAVLNQAQPIVFTYEKEIESHASDTFMRAFSLADNIANRIS